MPGYVTDSRTHNVSVQAVITSPGGIKSFRTKVLPGEQTTHSFRSGFRGPSVEEELRQDAQIYEPSAISSSFYDTGHEFWSMDRRYIGSSIKSYRWTDPNSGWSWQGPIVLLGQDSNAGLAPYVSPMSKASLSVKGARAVSATIPTKPEAGLSQFLGELKRDGIPSLVGSALIYKGAKPKNFGSDYLNVEFGWKPFINDILKLMKSVKNSSQIVRQFRRDSGRIVRRRFAFPATNSLTTTLYENTTPGTSTLANLSYTDFAWNSSRSIEISDSVEEQIWFSGAYTYYCDMGDTLTSRFARYEQLSSKLLGSRLTPGVLWDLAPWSWLADWFADVGLVLDNASAFQSDGLVMRYGYLMRHTKVHRTVSGTFRLEGQLGHTPVINSYLTERKERHKATPYGFGLLEESFDLRQWAILGALGMTKAPGLMR